MMIQSVPWKTAATVTDWFVGGQGYVGSDVPIDFGPPNERQGRRI